MGTPELTLRMVDDRRSSRVAVRLLELTDWTLGPNRAGTEDTGATTVENEGDRWTVSGWFGTIEATAGSVERRDLDDFVAFVDEATFDVLQTIHLVAHADSDGADGAAPEPSADDDPAPEALARLESAGLLVQGHDGWEPTAVASTIFDTIELGSPQVRVHLALRDGDGSADATAWAALYAGPEHSVEISGDDEGPWRVARFATEDFAARTLDITGLSAWPLGLVPPPDRELHVMCSVLSTDDDGGISGGATGWLQRGAELLAVEFSEDGQPTGSIDPVSVADLVAEIESFFPSPAPDASSGV